MTLALRRRAGCHRVIPFTLDRDDLRLHLGQPLDLPCNLPAEAFRQRPPISGDQFRWRQGLVARFNIDTANALTKQQTLDPVDVGRPLADQSVPFPMTAAKILFLNARDYHHGANVTLTPAPSNQRMKDTLNIDAVGLHPPRPPVDL